MNAAKDKMGIGVVGCGVIADIHAQAIADLETFELVSAYSRNPENARRFGEKFAVTTHTDWETFISDKKIDSVSICTPSGTHLDFGSMAAGRGKHVIIEKPIEVTVKRAKQLIKQCKQNKVALAVIYQNRFIPAVADLYLQLKNDVIGDLILVDVRVKWFRTQEYYDSAAWRGTLDLDGGGVLINQAIHTIDLLTWLAGPVQAVQALTAIKTHKRIEGEDNAVAVLEMKNGAVGTLLASTSVIPAQSRIIELHGVKGSVTINGDDVILPRAGQKSSPDKQPTPKGADSPLQNFPIQPHRDQFRAIYDAIRMGQDPPVSGADSMQSLAVVMAIYESARTNSRILIEI